MSDNLGVRHKDGGIEGFVKYLRRTRTSLRLRLQPLCSHDLTSLIRIESPRPKDECFLGNIYKLFKFP